MSFSNNHEQFTASKSRNSSTPAKDRNNRHDHARKLNQHLQAQMSVPSPEQFDASSSYGKPDDSGKSYTAPPQPRKSSGVGLPQRAQTPINRQASPQYANSPDYGSYPAGVTFYSLNALSESNVEQAASTLSSRARTTDMVSPAHPNHPSHTLIDLDEAVAPGNRSPYRNAPSLMPELVERHTSGTQLAMERVPGFAEATEKLDEIAQLSERIYAQLTEGVSVMKNMLLPAELEKLCKVMAKVREADYHGDDAFERRVVMTIKWDAVVNTLTHLAYPLRALPRDHPNRSKLIKEKMIRALEWLETETQNLQVAMEVFVGKEQEVAGKKHGKCSHLVTQISRVLEEWKEI